MSLLILLGLLLLVHPVVCRYCDGRWVDTGSIEDPFMNYSLNAARTVLDESDPRQSMEHFLRDACPSQVVSYNCHMKSKDLKRVDKLSEIHFIPYDHKQCMPFSPAAFLDLIRGRRVIVIGDSVVSEIYTSLICATYKTGTTHHHVFLQNFGPNGDHMRNAFINFKERNASLLFQKVFKPSDAEWLLYYNHHKPTRDDVVVLGFGLHYNTQEHFRREMGALAEWISALRDPPRFLLLHSTPQHAQSANGYFVPRAPTPPGPSCTPIPGLNESVLSVEEDAKTAPRKRHEEQALFAPAWRATLLEELFAPLVRRRIAFIAPISVGLNVRHDGHLSSDDCTHWCFPSDVFKYVHLMMYNALRHFIQPLPQQHTQETKDNAHNAHNAHNATADDSSEKWKFYPSLRNGNLIKFHRENSLYLVDNGRYREFQSFGAFVKNGFDTSQMETLDRGQIGPMTMGAPITEETVLPKY